MRYIFWSATFVLLLAVTLYACAGADQTFSIAPLSQKTITLPLTESQCVNGSFSVTGGTGTGLDFLISAPDGSKMLSSNFTSGQNFNFDANTNGNFTLTFSNSFCSCEGGKNVSLTYNVSQNALSSEKSDKSEELPTQTALLLSTAVAVAAVLASGALLLTRHKKRAENQHQLKRNNE